MPSLFPISNTIPRFADVVLPLNMPQVLTYGIPLQWQEVLQEGMRVEVALGKNKQYSGIVTRLHNEAPETYEVKPIRAVIDELPVVNKTQLQFWQWIGHYYMAAPGEVMQAALPAHLKLMGETRLQWAPRNQSELPEWTPAALPAVDALQDRKAITISDLRTIVSPKHLITVLHELLDAEAIIINDALEPVYKPKKEKWVRLLPQYEVEEALQGIFAQLSRAPKQEQLLMNFLLLRTKDEAVSYAALLERADASAAQLKTLVDKGILTIEERDADRVALNGIATAGAIIFTEAQQTAYDKLNEGLKEKDVVLLQGVTGSGKTLLYIEKIRECIAAGKQALLLLPEIGLTTQLVKRLYAYFGDALGVYHSRFSNNERVEIWGKVQRGTYQVVAGPRSALWLPYNELGIIIADEEHDSSYKQRDPAPRFHARDAAIYLASLHGGKVILGSATPSVESLYNVQQGKYAFAPLKERYKGVQLPTIEIVNATSLATVRQKGFQLLTPELQEAMVAALEANRQIILFQNRRGYAPFQICMSCGWVPQCTNCAVSLTYHKSSDKMHCHYCGQVRPVPSTCHQCGSNRITSRSFGTEKIEEEVKMAFPNARVARMDIDSMRGKQSLSRLLEDLEEHRVDILVGTQMVVKGLDFSPVSLVGVLSADSLLSYPDFRVNERAFQLMEQVSGRAGRADGAGKVIIQAYNLQHPVLEWVKAHDVAAFYRQEIGFREFFHYPPFVRLIKVIFKHKDEPKALDAASQFAIALQQLGALQVQGPVPGIVARVRNQYVQEIWIKCPRDVRVLEQTKAFLKMQRNTITAQRGLSDVQILFDVDPA